MLPPQIPHLVDTSVHVELSGDKGMEVGKMGGFLCLPAHAEQYPLLARNGRQIPEPRYGALSDHSPKEGVAPSYGLAGLIYGVGKKFVSQKHAMTGDIIMTHPGPKNIGSSRPPTPDESQNGNLLSIEFLKTPSNPPAPSDKDIVEGMSFLGDPEFLGGYPSLL